MTEMLKKETLHEIDRIIQNFEEEKQIELSMKVVNEVLAYCIRKLPHINKEESYLPILFKCELPIQMQISRIKEHSLDKMKDRKEEKRRCVRFADRAPAIQDVQMHQTHQQCTLVNTVVNL